MPDDFRLLISPKIPPPLSATARALFEGSGSNTSSFAGSLLEQAKIDSKKKIVITEYVCYSLKVKKQITSVKSLIEYFIYTIRMILKIHLR